jgi:hypothetical protein
VFTVTTEIDPTTAAVRLLVDGGIAPYVADASPGGARADYRVRTTWSSVPGSATARLGIDGAIPLNTPTQYVVTDAAGIQVSTPAVVVSSDVALLSDATNPTAVVAVCVASQKPNRWEGRSVWWDILGSRAPFASTAPLRYRAGPLTLRVDDLADRNALLEIMAPGNPMLIRSVSPGVIDDVVMLVEAIDEDLVLVDDPAGPVLWTITYQAISADLGPYAPDANRTYSEIAATFPDYSSLPVAYATYGTMRAGDPVAGLGPELVADPSFATGATSWDTFWTPAGTTVTYPGTFRAEQTAAPPVGYCVVGPRTLGGVYPGPTQGGTRYRITGRVRSSSPASTVTVETVVNIAPAAPQYFTPGAVITTYPVTASPAWQSFTVDVEIPPGYDVWNLFLRGTNMQPGAVVEFDDVTARERL